MQTGANTNLHSLHMADDAPACVECQKCKRRALVTLDALKKGGASNMTTLASFVGRLSCSECGSRDVTIQAPVNAAEAERFLMGEG